MGNITVRRDNGNRPAMLANVEPRWEPFRLMRDSRAGTRSAR